jgi:uncharacterized protein (DUF433 family)
MSREQGEALAIARPDHGEVAAVESCERRDVSCFSHCYDAGIHQAEAKVGVLVDQLPAASVLVPAEVGYFKLAVDDEVEKAGFRPWSEVVLDLPGGLGNDRCGYDLFPAVLVQHTATRFVVRIIGVRRAEEHAGVNDDRHRSAAPRSLVSSARISRCRRERSPRPEDPDPMKASRASSRGNWAVSMSATSVSVLTPRLSAIALMRSASSSGTCTFTLTLTGPSVERSTIEGVAGHYTLRLAPGTKQRLAEQARCIRVAEHTLAQRYVEEGLRHDLHPLIQFLDGPSGRRASLVGRGLDIWEVISTVQDNEGSVEAAAEYLHITVGLVEAAVAYYGEHRAEVDEEIALNEQEYHRGLGER